MSIPLATRVDSAFFALANGKSIDINPLINEISELTDEHHTMQELYDFRMAMHAHLAIMWHRLGLYPVVKSFRHHDGEACFGGGWFIVTAQLGSGQVSNHYKEEYWSLFDIPSVEFVPEWDGHSSEDVLNRLKAELPMLPIQIMRVGLNDRPN